MKRRTLLLFFSIAIICAISYTSISIAQDFDSISNPPDISASKGESVGITWQVSISSVTAPTYDVYINSQIYIDDFVWELEGNTGIITINVNTDTIGSYNYTIVVKDGAGHEISDEVIVTIGEPGWWENFWSSRTGYIIFGVLAFAFFFGLLYVVRKRGMSKSDSIIPR